MTNPQSNLSNAGTHWSPSFKFGLWPAVGLVLAFTTWVLVSVTTFTWLFGAKNSLLLKSLWSVPSGLVQFGIIAAVYRYDDVTLGEIGLSKRLLRPAVIAAAGVVIVLNAVVFGMALLANNEITYGVYAFYQSDPFNLSWTAIAAGALSSYLFIGPAEELAFRGYLQNKLIALFEFRSVRVRTATSIVATGLIFSALHIPVEILIAGTQIPQLVGMLSLLALSGIVFGTIYALTQNLYLVILLHGIGDFWPFVIDPGRGIWPNYVVLLLVYLILVVLYRQALARTTLPTPSLPAAD